MTATLLSTQHFSHAHLRMPAGHSWEGQYGYDQYNQAGQASNYQAQLSQMPVHSLDFLDVSARSYPTPQASSIGHPPTPSSIALSWQRDSRGHARSTSESQVSIDEFDDLDEDGIQSNVLQRWTSASSADPASIRRKMKRFRLTHNQTRFLMNEFHREPHPDAAHREYLSQKIPGLSPRQVQVWFQNRRAKSKRVVHDHESITKSRAQQHESDRSQSPRSRATSAQSPSTLSSIQTLHVPGHPEIMRQASTAELFAQSLSDAAPGAVPASVSPAAEQRLQEEVPDARRHKRTRQRAATTLLFGREVTVLVDETDTGSDFDEDESDDEEDDLVSPILSDSAHQYQYAFPTQSMARTEYTDMPLHSPAVELDCYHMGPWGMPQGQAAHAFASEAARRASVSTIAQQHAAFPTPLQRPSMTARPSWPGVVPNDANSAIGSIWYQTHKSAYNREQQQQRQSHE